MASKKCHIVLKSSEYSEINASESHNMIAEASPHVVTFYQQNADLCIATERNDRPKWSSVIPGNIRNASISRDGHTVAASTSDKCYISTSSDSFCLDYIPLPSVGHQPSPQGSWIEFAGADSAHLALASARDIRIVDIKRSVVKFNSAPRLEAVKPLMTISGAAAQALPESFTFLRDSPQVVVTGWELGPSPYIRIVDLREGTSKSVRIWKAKHIHGLTGSTIDSGVIAGFCGKETVVWDLRSTMKGVKGGQSSGEDMVVSKFSDLFDVSQIDWSPAKRGTIGVLSEGGISVHRTDIARTDKISHAAKPDQRIGAFKFSPTNDIIVMYESDGTVGKLAVRKDPIPVCNPRTGIMLAVSNTGRVAGGPISPADAALATIVKGLEHLTLVEAIRQCGDADLLEEVDWVLADRVHFDTVAEPLSGKFTASSEQDASSVTAGLGVAVVTSSLRTGAIELLLSERDRQVIIPLIQGDWEGLLRTLVMSGVNDTLTKSITRKLVGSDGGSMIETDGSSSAALKYTVEVVNRIITAGSPSKRLPEIRIILRQTAKSVEELLVHAVLALSYLPTPAEVSECISSIASQSSRFNSLRSLVLTGVRDAVPKSTNVVGMGLIGLLLFLSSEPTSFPAIFPKAVKFLREMSNQQQSAFWRLRSVIDSIVTCTAATAGSARLVCYYCSKPVTGPAAESAAGDSMITRCPHRGCHKPLPSCCVCLEPLRVSTNAKSPVELDDWIVWCSTCRHGGHKGHLTEWFGTFDECPVAGCTCQCANVDGM